ncbi:MULTISPECIES: LacI family DNA-binding transcriptional regulator [Flavobacteriaceae]|uniref:LacI family DNA-binding transcriptional regulator n=1 Tax=Flavobacteriaceae TaxID=49546 RepID=UPI0014910645|nr:MULTISPECIES: LacI family DNA-binding transcriptional regulator [Allomuricauda]MDC6366256.1 LacI family DNA-binding transcriptional regulator [Muricauda sp. AC10]
MIKRVSLKDIANTAQVSTSLVSYVINNKWKENRIPEDTAKRILKIAKELNYEPNIIAQSLKTKKTKTIGVILADISNSFFSFLAREIEDLAYSRGYTAIFCSSDENLEKFTNIVDFLMTRQVDGFIIAAPEGSESILKNILQKVPVVLVDRYFPKIGAHTVKIDNFQASFIATDYLVKKGHQKIAAIVYDSKFQHFNDRLNGYLASLMENNIEPDNDLVKKVDTKSLKRDMKKIIQRLVLENKVTALYFHTNTLAEEGLRQIQSLDKALIKNLDIAAFDRNPFYDLFENRIQYLNQPIHEIGKKSVILLTDIIEGKTQKSPQHICLEATLALKETVPSK